MESALAVDEEIQSIMITINPEVSVKFTPFFLPASKHFLICFFLHLKQDHMKRKLSSPDNVSAFHTY